jgi:sugar phosphate isomerase/epimerase
MSYRLAINTGFAVNRYSEPEEWTQIVGEELGLRFVQFTADMLNPDLPTRILRNHAARIVRGLEKHQSRVSSTFTGAFTRVNHLASPDEELRRHWVKWFHRFIDLSVDLGAESMGSHFGIFTHADNADQKRREVRRRQNIEHWHQVAEYARDMGLKEITWEPMSINREQGETLEEARRLQDDVNTGAPLPFRLCLDLNHGDWASLNPDDRDPYVWLHMFGSETSQVHLKQSSSSNKENWPFTEQHNVQGSIIPKKVLKVLDEVKTEQSIELILELSFREREPHDSTVVEVLRESVDYWRTVVTT